MRVKKKSHARIRCVIALILILCTAYAQAASNNHRLLTVDEVTDIVSQQEPVLVDAAPPLTEFPPQIRQLIHHAGAAKQPHIIIYGERPSAMNTPWAKNHTKNHTGLRPIDELKGLYKTLMADEIAAVYKKQSKKSAVNDIALSLLGANGAANAGSWFDWRQQLGL